MTPTTAPQPATVPASEPTTHTFPQTIRSREQHRTPPDRKSAEPAIAPRPTINRAAFTRGVTERNCAWFMVAFIPIRAELKQKAREYLGADTAVADVTLGLLVDDALVLAFEASEQWYPRTPTLDWVADFLPKAIHQFGDLTPIDCL